MTIISLIKKVDCIRLSVPDLEEGLAFYRDRLGLQMVWRTALAAGLRMADTDTEIVLHTEEKEAEIDLLVDSADQAAEVIRSAGGKVVAPPFDIPIGRCLVMQDPWGNELVLLDMSKGPLITDESGMVIE